ncbi:MAG: monovalent cation/H+ antiporter subunit D family protein, partial [Gammaproteobacteria bacterium]
MTAQALMLSMLALPLLAAVGIALLGRWPDLREALSVTVAVTVAACAVALYPHVRDGAVVTWQLAEPLPGLPIVLSIEPLGMLFALVAGLLWPVTTLYSIGYMRCHNEQQQTRFYA